MKNRLCGRRPPGLLQFMFHREIGLCGTEACAPTDVSLQLAEEKATLPVKNQSCELSGQSRSTFLMAFSPDGKKIASTHGDHSVRVTTIKTGQCTHILTGHPRTPWCLAFHPSSNDILASGCLGGEVRIWDLRGGGSEVWKSDKGCVIASLTFHPVEHVLVIATTNELLFWDWTRPEPFARCKTAYDYERVRWVKFDPWGHHLYTGIANSSGIQREDVPHDGVSHMNTDTTTHGERLRLRQRYRNIVQQITSHQRERILGSHHDNPFLVSSSSSEETNYSGPHHADLDIVEPRSPNSAETVSGSLSYPSPALARARQYAANVTSASLLGAGEHVERAVVRVRNEHAVERAETAPSTSIDHGRNQSNPREAASSSSSSLSSSSSSPSSSSSASGLPSSSQSNGVTLPVSLGLTRILPPPVGSQEASSGELYLSDQPSFPEEQIVPPSSLLGASDPGASFDFSPFTNTEPSVPEPRPQPRESQAESHNQLDASINPLSLINSFPYEPLSRSHLSNSDAFGSHSVSDSAPLSSHSIAGRMDQSDPTSLTGHGASGLTLLANAGLALELQERNSMSSSPLSSASSPFFPSSGAPPVQSSSSRWSTLFQPTYVNPPSASVSSASLSSHPNRPSLLRSQLELLQAQGSRSQEESITGSNSLLEPIASTSRPVEQPRRLASLIESEVRQAIENVRARQIDIRETLNALDQLQADTASAGLTDILSTSSPAVTSVSDNQVSSIITSSVNTSSRSGISVTSTRISPASSPVIASTSSRTSTNLAQPFQTPPDINLPGDQEAQEFPESSSVRGLSEELSRRLAHLTQLDQQVNQITARLDNRMRALASERQREIQQVQSTRTALHTRQRMLASERIRERQTRLNDMRRRYFLSRERDGVPRQSGRTDTQGDLGDSHNVSHPPSIDLPEDVDAGYSESEREIRDFLEEPAASTSVNSSSSSRSERFSTLDARYRRRRHWQLHQEIQSMRAELAQRRQQQREQERTWHTLQRRHLHPHYAVSILDDTINRQNDGLQAAINRAIAGVFMGSGETAVANNIVNLTHRIQRWDFRQCNVPDISHSEEGIVVPHCKLHNDASCEISSDGQLLLAFVPSHRGFPDDTILGVFSLRPESFGQCLFTKSFGPNAISVSLSPLGCYVLVGLAAKRLAWVFTPKQMVAQIYQLKTAHAGEESMEHICDLMHPCEVDIRSHVSVNSARWLPGVGQGVAYGTNRGDLHICRPGDEGPEPRDRARNSPGAGNELGGGWNQRRNLMQLLGLSVPRTATTATQTTQRIRRTASTQTERAAFE